MEQKNKWEYEMPGVHSRWPVELQPKSDILNKPLIVNLAPSGTHINRTQNPNQPYYPEEILKEVKECFALGVSMWHLHVRDRKTEMSSVEPKLVRDTIQMVKAECKDIISSVHLDYDKSRFDRGLFLKTVEALAEIGGLPDTVVIHTASKTSRKVFEEGLADQVKYIEEMGMKPELQCQTFIGIDNVKRWLIDKEIPQKPYFVNHHIGKQETVPLSFPNPWNYIVAMSMLQLYPPNSDSVVGLYAGGRYWLPITVLGIMQGVDVVRPGMEDAVYMYPHSEDKIKNNASMVEKVVAIAEKLGRRIATPAEARKILGLKSNN